MALHHHLGPSIFLIFIAAFFNVQLPSLPRVSRGLTELRLMPQAAGRKWGREKGSRPSCLWLFSRSFSACVTRQLPLMCRLPDLSHTGTGRVAEKQSLLAQHSHPLRKIRAVSQRKKGRTREGYWSLLPQMHISEANKNGASLMEINKTKSPQETNCGNWTGTYLKGEREYEMQVEMGWKWTPEWMVIRTPGKKGW